ncbi:MAG: hypothetical protein ABIF89_01180 [bacterium]
MYLPCSASFLAAPVFDALNERAVGACIDFWQVLPFRGLSPKTVRRSLLPVLYCEEGWRTWELIVNECPWHVGLFWRTVFQNPDPWVKEMKKSGSTFISHKPEDIFTPGNLVELKPERERFRWFLEQARKKEKPCLVLDTRHIRDFPETWQQIVSEALALTRVIHVQPTSSEELVKFLQGEKTVLADIVIAMKKGGFDGDWIIEINPAFTLFKGAIFDKVIAPFVERLRYLLNQASA